LQELNVNNSYENLPTRTIASRPSSYRPSRASNRIPEDIQLIVTDRAENDQLCKEELTSSPPKPKKQGKVNESILQPSMLNIPSSPPKIERMSMGLDKRDSFPSCRMSTADIGVRRLTERTRLPPERAEAAKRRLEMRSRKKELRNVVEDDGMKENL
jgi:hypothetical protein